MQRNKTLAAYFSNSLSPVLRIRDARLDSAISLIPLAIPVKSVFCNFYSVFFSLYRLEQKSIDTADNMLTLRRLMSYIYIYIYI